jgi:hypothetical protein
MSTPRFMLALAMGGLVAVVYRRREDLTIALLELLAWAGDKLSYEQDAVANEAYLNTARPRISMRRHRRLADDDQSDQSGK